MLQIAPMRARGLKRTARATGTLVVVVLLAAVLAEVTLQVASLFARDRAGAGWRPGATYKVLCVGDSHTYGAGEPEQDSYPAQLQGFLDERAPGRYAVLNLGVPGMNTAQVLRRLPVLVARFDPDLVVVWAGVVSLPVLTVVALVVGGDANPTDFLIGAAAGSTATATAKRGAAEKCYEQNFHFHFDTSTGRLGHQSFISSSYTRMTIPPM